MRLGDLDELRQYWLENGENEFVYDTNAILCSIDEVPTVELINNKTHAKWIRNDCDVLVCSNCKNEPLLNEQGFWCESAFCPHCGADMN